MCQLVKQRSHRCFIHANFSNPNFSFKNDHAEDHCFTQCHRHLFLISLKVLQHGLEQCPRWSALELILQYSHVGVGWSKAELRHWVLSCHCHVLGGCTGGKTTTKPTAPCKAKNNYLFCLDPQEEGSFPGSHSQPQTIQCLLPLPSAEGTAGFGTALMSPPAAPLSYPCPPGGVHALQPLCRQRAAPRASSSAPAGGNLLKAQHFRANADSRLSLEQGFQYGCGQNLLQRKLCLFIFWRHI